MTHVLPRAKWLALVRDSLGLDPADLLWLTLTQETVVAGVAVRDSAGDVYLDPGTLAPVVAHITYAVVDRPSLELLSPLESR